MKNIETTFAAKKLVICLSLSLITLAPSFSSLADEMPAYSGYVDVPKAPDSYLGQLSDWFSSAYLKKRNDPSRKYENTMVQMNGMRRTVKIPEGWQDMMLQVFFDDAHVMMRNDIDYDLVKRVIENRVRSSSPSKYLMSESVFSNSLGMQYDGLLVKPNALYDYIDELTLNGISVSRVTDMREDKSAELAQVYESTIPNNFENEYEAEDEGPTVAALTAQRSALLEHIAKLEKEADDTAANQSEFVNAVYRPGEVQAIKIQAAPPSNSYQPQTYSGTAGNIIRGQNGAGATTSTLSEEEQAETKLTIYGETVRYGDLVNAENKGRVPHSNGRGHQLGIPVPTRTHRILDKLLVNNPLTAEEQITVTGIFADQERALYAAPEINHVTRKIVYSESAVPEIFVAKNSVATISFLDKKGNPYPVNSSDPQKFGGLFTTRIPAVEGQRSNTIIITGQTLNGSGNIVALLGGRTLPAPFKINMTESKNDAKLTVMFDELAPGIQEEPIEIVQDQGFLCANDILSESILDGIIPSVAKKVTVSNPTFSVYKAAGSYYLRTKQNVTSPSCECILYGVEDIKMCKIPSSTPSVLYMDARTDTTETLYIKG